MPVSLFQMNYIALSREVGRQVVPFKRVDVEAVSVVLGLQAAFFF